MKSLLLGLASILVTACASSPNYHPRLLGLDPSYGEERAKKELARVLAQEFEILEGHLRTPSVEIGESEVRLVFPSAQAGWSERRCAIDLGEKQDFIAKDRGNDSRIPRATQKRFIVVADDSRVPVCGLGFASDDLSKDLANALYSLQRRKVSREAIAVAINPEPVGFAPIPGRVSVLRGEEKWSLAEKGFPKATQVAVLEGDPKGPGAFTARVLLPAMSSTAAYAVSTAERMTVLSGSVWVSFGKKANRDQGRRYDAGSFLLTPPGVVHTVWTESDAALYQVNGEGPWQPKAQ